MRAWAVVSLEAGADGVGVVFPEVIAGDFGEGVPGDDVSESESAIEADGEDSGLGGVEVELGAGELRNELEDGDGDDVPGVANNDKLGEDGGGFVGVGEG